METYLRDFQDKVPNYIICTNILLKKLGKVDSDVCSSCNFSREDLEHLLFVCPLSKVFWNDFRLFWYDVMKEDITSVFLSRGDRSLRVVIVARTNCEPLDKRLLICHLLNRRRIFSRNVLLSFFYKRFVFDVF